MERDIRDNSDNLSELRDNGGICQGSQCDDDGRCACYGSGRGCQESEIDIIDSIIPDNRGGRVLRRDDRVRRANNTSYIEDTDRPG